MSEKLFEHAKVGDKVLAFSLDCSIESEHRYYRGLCEIERVGATAIWVRIGSELVTYHKSTGKSWNGYTGRVLPYDADRAENLRRRRDAWEAQEKDRAARKAARDELSSLIRSLDVASFCGMSWDAPAEKTQKMAEVVRAAIEQIRQIVEGEGE